MSLFPGRAICAAGEQIAKVSDSNMQHTVYRKNLTKMK